MTREEFIVTFATTEILNGQDPARAIQFWAKEWDQSQVSEGKTEQARAIAMQALAAWDQSRP